MFPTVWFTVIFTLVGRRRGEFSQCLHQPDSRGHFHRFPCIPLSLSAAIRSVSMTTSPSSVISSSGESAGTAGEESPSAIRWSRSLTALFAWVLFWKYGLTPAYPAVFLFVCTLIVITFIDIDQQIIPHVLTLTGIPIFALLAVLFMGLTVVDAFLGIMIGAGVLYFVAVYYEALTGREGMGGGDVNLLAMLGAFLGWKSLLFILLVSSLIGRRRGNRSDSAQRQGHAVCHPLRPFSLRGSGLIPLYRGGSDRTVLFL